MARLGRPLTYDRKYHCEQAENLTLLGCTDAEMASAFQVNQDTLHVWRGTYPEFSEAIARGKILADARMAKSLYHRGLGYSHKATKIFMPAGADAPVYAEYTQHYPPDTPAAALWLQNRRGRKREAGDAIMWTQRIEHTGADGGPISLEALLMRADEMEQGQVIEHQAAEALTQDIDSTEPNSPTTPSDKYKDQ